MFSWQAHAKRGDFPGSLTKRGSFYDQAQADARFLRSSTHQLRSSTGPEKGDHVLRRKANGGKVFSKLADEMLRGARLRHEPFTVSVHGNQPLFVRLPNDSEPGTEYFEHPRAATSERTI